MAKVMVEVLAEQMFHGVDNGNGTHTHSHYLRGNTFEMDEQDALAAAEGEEPKSPYIAKNGAGTEVWVYPPKTPGMARAAVRILKAGTAKPTAPVAMDTFKPAPAPRPAGSERQ